MTTGGRFALSAFLLVNYVVFFYLITGTATDSGFTIWEGVLWFIIGSVVGHALGILINRT